LALRLRAAHCQRLLAPNRGRPPQCPRKLSDDADALCDLSATELVARMQRKELSARDVMAAHLARIARVNPRVNAIVTLVADRAMAEAARADERIVRGETAGVLHGLPIAHKDLVDTAGIRTTYGSLFYADHVPAKDALIVSRIRAAGAITCGKTNAPEFGAGSQTFNRVFGATRNPFDLTRTCGGSSGGAAAALACGMLPIADGSDTGGSLRNPAAFCSVVGFRDDARPGRQRFERLVAAFRVRPDGAIGGRSRIVPERYRRRAVEVAAVARGRRRPLSGVAGT
jgi:amidase